MYVMHLKFGFDCRLVSLEVPDFTKCPSWKILKPYLELKTNLENPPMIWFPDQFTEFQLLFYLGNSFTIFSHLVLIYRGLSSFLKLGGATSNAARRRSPAAPSILTKYGGICPPCPPLY